MNATEETSGTSPAFPQSNRSGFHIFCRPIFEVNALIAVYSILIFVIVTSNSIIIFTFLKNRKIRTVPNYFFASLAVSDILVGCVSIPMWLYMFVFPLHNNCGLPSVSFLKVYRYLDIFSAISSTAHLMAISFERSLAITRPLRHRACPKNFFYSLIVIAWFYGLLTSVLIVSDISETWMSYRAVAVFAVGFCFPFLTIIILYSMTYRSVKSYVRRRRNNSSGGNMQKYLHKEKRTALTVGFVLAAFLFAWLPFFVVSLVATFCTPCRRSLLGFTPTINFVKILHYSNSAINPFIYTFRNSIWKRAFLKAVLPCVSIADENTGKAHWQSKCSDLRKQNPNGFSRSFERRSPNSSEVAIKMNQSKRHRSSTKPTQL